MEEEEEQQDENNSNERLELLRHILARSTSREGIKPLCKKKTWDPNL